MCAQWYCLNQILHDAVEKARVTEVNKATNAIPLRAPLHEFRIVLILQLWIRNTHTSIVSPSFPVFFQVWVVIACV